MDVYGLIGKSLSHSFSKSFFEEKFSNENINAKYLNFELNNINEFVDLIEQNKDLKGLNVTVPYKTQIIPYLDELSEVAKEIGAVNTIILKNGKLIGDNTDVFGFRQSIKPFLRNVHEKALILGTGGASKAVGHVLRKIGIEVYFLSSSKKGERIFNYEQVNDFMINTFKLVVNTTPVGMYPNVKEMPKISLNGLTEDHLVYDLIYNPETTELLKKAKENGADVLNGASMLRLQALESWRLWNQ